MQALDELVARWRKNPDTESTLALCAHLGTAKHSDLLREVGNTAEAWHKDNHPVMLSVGRMYLDAGLLAEAQSSFIQAGKAAPGDSEAYRFLGEVLLRRGDAQRGQRALAKAIKLGDEDPDTRLWHERAVVYGALQKRRGAQAVAHEVARTAPHQPSIPVPVMPPSAEEPRPRRGQRRSRPPGARPSGPRRSSPPGALRRRPSQSPPPQPAAQATLMMGVSSVPARPMHPRPEQPPPMHPPSPFFPSDSESPARRMSAVPASDQGGFTAPAAAAPQAGGFFPVESSPPTERQPDADSSDLSPSDPFRGTFPDDDDHALPDPQRGMGTVPDVHHVLDEVAANMQDVRPLPDEVPEPPAVSTAAHAPALGSEGDDYDEQNPSPEAVLLTLSRVGLFESEGSVAPAWESPRQPVPRRLWGMAGAVALTCALGVVGYRHAMTIQAERAAEAQGIAVRVASMLDGGSLEQLRASDESFQRLFDLDSRGGEAALLWLKNRALTALTSAAPVSGVEAAMQRARSVGVAERSLAFGRLASALSADDLPGAARVISEWDERAGDDAYFQLFAGAALERAGDAGALERLQKATVLSPEVVHAHALAARLAILQRGGDAARDILEPAYGRLGPGAAAQVLRGLEWAAAPAGDAKPPELPTETELAQISPALRRTAHGVAGVIARREGRIDDARQSFDQALTQAAAPAMAAWIGYQALEAGAVDVARRAALKAMKVSVRHKSSQALAARIALAEGRLAEAQKATVGLAPSTRDAVLIEAVTAYEKLQLAPLRELLADLHGKGGKAGLEALERGRAVILGDVRARTEVLEKLASSEQVWGQIVAADLALDAGNLEFVAHLASQRGWNERHLAHAQRLTRLYRYQNQLDPALQAAAVVLDARGAGARALGEAMLTLIDGRRTTAARGALAQASDDLGELGPWLNALLEARAGSARSASRALRMRLPSKKAPVIERVVALRALAAAKDRRAKSYAAQLKRQLPGHPDVARAVRDLGL